MSLLIAVTVLCIIQVFLFVMLYRNSLTEKILIEWCNEVYENRVNGDSSLDWSDLPTYSKVLFNFFLWRHKPLKEYLNKDCFL
jgi:hypothetical protein